MSEDLKWLSLRLSLDRLLPLCQGWRREGEGRYWDNLLPLSTYFIASSQAGYNHSRMSFLSRFWLAVFFHRAVLFLLLCFLPFYSPPSFLFFSVSKMGHSLAGPEPVQDFVNLDSAFFIFWRVLIFPSISSIFDWALFLTSEHGVLGSCFNDSSSLISFREKPKVFACFIIRISVIIYSGYCR